MKKLKWLDGSEPIGTVGFTYRSLDLEKTSVIVEITNKVTCKGCIREQNSDECDLDCNARNVILKKY